MVKTWRPTNWEAPQVEHLSTREAYEAGADAMLQALRKMRDEKNREYNIKSPLGFIPDD